MTANILVLICCALLISSLTLAGFAWRDKPESSVGHNGSIHWACFADRETVALFGVICWAVGVAMCSALFLLLLLVFGHAR